MAAILVAKEELLSINDFQKEIHYNDADSDDGIEADHYRKFIKSTWYSSVLTKLECTQDGAETIYRLNNSFHFLKYTYLHFNVPAVKVKADFLGRIRICWCHNLGINISQQATFKEDDDTYQTFDKTWGDIYPQYYQEAGAGKRENFNVGVGNVDILEEWTEYLPAHPITIDQPWFYTMNPFPIWPKMSATKAEHRYTFRRKVTDLLRMEAKTKEKDKDGNAIWRPITKNLYKYIDIVGSAEIPIPELWGRYSYVTDRELEWYITCDADKRDEDGSQSRIFYTRDIISCDIQNPVKYKSIADIDLASQNPCLAFFWVAENCDATAIHNFSNYTTNTNDLYKGWDPVKWTTFKYGNTTYLDKMPSEHFNIAQSKHFPSLPSETGYHAYSYSNYSNNFNGEIGIVFDNLTKKASLKCQIDNGDLFLNKSGETNNINEDDEDDDFEIESAKEITKSVTNPAYDSPEFILRVRLLIMRKFTIHSKKIKGEENKYSHGFEIK